MANQYIMDITYVAVQTSLLILQIQDKQDTFNLYITSTSLVLMTTFLVISVIQQRFKLESQYYEVFQQFIKLTLYSFETANDNKKVIIEQIINIKYILLGVYFSNLINLNYNLITWRKVIKISLFNYYSLTIIILSQDFNEDKVTKICLLILFSLPFEIFLLYSIYKKQKETQSQSNQNGRENNNFHFHQNKQIQIENIYEQENVSYKKLTQSQFQRNCSIFSHLFPDGLVLLGDKEEIIHMNSGMNKILQQENQKFMLNQVLDLQNCTEEFQDEEQFRNLFRGLESKFQHQKNRENDQNFQSPHIYIYESLIVRNEYEKAINIAKIELNLIVNKIYSQDQSLLNDQKNKNKQFYDHQYLYQSKLICRLNFENLLSIIDEQQEFQQFNEDFKEKKKAEQQNKLIEVTISSYIQENLEPCVCIIVKDVTLFNELNVEKQMNQNKSKMLSQVAHEFRNPLNCIVLLSENAAENFQQNQTLLQEYLEPIVTSANQLLSLVNDLLDLSQLNAGKFSIVNQEFDIHKLITNIYKMLLPQATVRNLYLQINISKNIPKILTSDPNRIRQIIMNLISNSLKFTFKGGIIISLKKESQNYYKISVEDSGIGIDVSDQSRLFQAFGKIESSKNFNQQGVGLGLMISHIMAQRLSQQYLNEQTQGLIAHSEGNNQGSLFYFIVFDHSNNPSLSLCQSSSSKKQISFDLLNFQISSKKFSSKSPVNSQGSQLQPNSAAQLQKKEKKFLPDSVKKRQHQTIVKNEFTKLKASVRNRKQSMDEIQYFKNIRIEAEEPEKIFSPKYSRDYQNIRIVGESEEDFSPKDLNSNGYSQHKRIVGQPEQFFSLKVDLSENLQKNKYWFKQCQCKEILLIDDQPFNNQALTLSLEKYNLKILSVISNYQTVRLLNELKVQICCQWIRIILMDLEMPISDGFQTTIDIRNMEKVIKLTNSNFVPSYIIGCSGHGLEIKKKCLDIGMNDYLTKPVKKMDLINIIQNLVQLETKI